MTIEKGYKGKSSLAFFPLKQGNKIRLERIVSVCKKSIITIINAMTILKNDFVLQMILSPPPTNNLLKYCSSNFKNPLH
jgi:hypothetical protein